MSKKKKNNKRENDTGYELTKGSKLLIVLMCVISALSFYILCHVFPAYLNMGLPT